MVEASRLVLHLGAHRTGTTLFQEYLYRRKSAAAEQGIRVDGIRETRAGLLNGILYGAVPDAVAAHQQRLAEDVARVLDGGGRWLLSDENLLGTMERNLALRGLYPDAADQVARLGPVLDQVDTIYLSIRSLPDWWLSAIAYLSQRAGAALPAPAARHQIAQNPRSWRDVVAELLAAFPVPRLVVREFGYHTGNPKRQLREVTGWTDLGKLPNLRKTSNASARAEGPPALFAPEDAAILQARYQADLEAMRGLLQGRGRFLRLADAKSAGVTADD